MLKKHKNGFIEIIKEKELDPASFEAEEFPAQDFTENEQFVIRLRNSPLLFRVTRYVDSFHRYQCEFTYFDELYPVKTLVREDFYPIKVVYEAFGDWLDQHVSEYLDEIGSPDLWALMQHQKPLISADEIGDEDRSMFTEEERKQLRLSINDFRLLIVKTFEPSKDELKSVNDRLDYVAEALDRSPRLDWRSLMLQTLLSISIALSLSREQGEQLFDLFKQVFSAALYLIQQ